MSAPNVTEIQPFCVPSFDKSDIKVDFQWDPLASVNYSALFMRGQEALEVVSLHDHQPSVIWKATGMAPGILNVVIIETEDGSCNISSVHPVSVLPGASALEMIEVFKKTETYCWETSPCLPPPLAEHQNSTETPLLSEIVNVSQNSASLTRQYIWKDQVKPFAMDLEFLLTELEENGGDGSELLDVVRNISTFLIEVNAKETLRFVLETCADFNVQYNWGPISIDSESGLNRLYEMVKFQRPNEEEEEEEDNSNEEEEVDFNNEFGGSSESEESSGESQGQEEMDNVIVDHYQLDGGGDVGIVRLESSDDVTNEQQLLPSLEDEIWRPIQVSEAPLLFSSLATCANSSSAFDDQISTTVPSGCDLPSPIQWCTLPQTLAEEEVSEIEDVVDKSEVGTQEEEVVEDGLFERDNQQDSDPANSGSDIVVRGAGSFGGTMVTIGVGQYSVIGVLLPTLVLSWWLSFKASSSNVLFFGSILQQQGSGVFLGFISTVLVLFILKKLASMSYNIPKLDSITRFVLIQVLAGAGISLFAQHFHVEEASRLICLVQALQVLCWLGVLLKTRLRVSIHFQLCLFFIDIVTFFFIVSHYSNTYCSNEGNNYCFSVFTTYLVGKVFALFLASIDGRLQIQKDQSTKMMN